jgi:hypothetical protein
MLENRLGHHAPANEVCMACLMNRFEFDVLGLLLWCHGFRVDADYCRGLPNTLEKFITCVYQSYQLTKLAESTV